ncbi:hypothetical protein A3F29_01455 [Candidatus Roizmanbacteria bacterium RIFCSPHIGHO2_12_FULL_33_9]|uniref:Uncharacterized protein n=1 Tax=Candidatus Roizmanbacteria bacterium RIFCSPHIGHO2_12_FULL_33_9 TaxID=1802045 RepID=A0A1F7HJG4_9BACT|nr:MAG: hypothetical protein A3F29_01455 [Candidatus Roizmanbacteria bacterium RIFCSPHIGHO2_12_FULL_33_9]
MKRKWEIVAYWFGIFLIFYAIYLGLYQSAINEKAALEEEHCVEINPLIIERKTVYLDSMSAILLEGDVQKYIDLTEEYEDTALDYIHKEKEWLEKDWFFLKNSLNRFVFDNHVMRGFELGHELSEADLRGTILIIDLFNDYFVNLGENQAEIQNKLKQHISNLDTLGIEIEKNKVEIDRASSQSIRNLFVRYPESKCPDENYDIPDVERELEEIFKDREPVSYPGVGA